MRPLEGCGYREYWTRTPNAPVPVVTSVVATVAHTSYIRCGSAVSPRTSHKGFAISATVNSADSSKISVILTCEAALIAEPKRSASTPVPPF
mgnify:CR=1 FL=1